MQALIDRYILSWKKEYRDIYKTVLNGNIYIFRLLTRGEYIDILGLQDSGYDGQDLILKSCMLYPKFSKKKFDSYLAGEVDYLAGKILQLSGFSNSDSILNDIEKERQKVDILDNQIIVLICKAFPHLTPYDIDKLNYKQLLRYLVMAESILDTKLIIEKQKPERIIDFQQENADLMGKKRPSNKRGDDRLK